MAKSKWMEKLQKLPGAVDFSYNYFDHVVRSKSPSLNFIFGKGWGLPLGTTAIFWGPAKSGKSLSSYLMAAELHATDPEAIVVRFDTEMRGGFQLTADTAKTWGIDMNRFITYNTNTPNEIFDTIEKEILSYIQDGMPLKMIIIDSLSGIRGRRSLNADTIDTQQIGDQAMTLQDGLSRILHIVKKNKIALVLTAHARAEMDPLEIRRGKKYKMQSAFAAQHFAEYFVLVERNYNKEGRTDLLGREFVNEQYSDLVDNSEATGHKIRVKMVDCSAGGSKGRTGEFTFDYNRGLINVHEEVFRLGVNRGVITKPSTMSYEYNGMKWTGRANCIQALEASKELQEAIIAELIDKDNNGGYSSQEVVLQNNEETPLNDESPI